MKLRSIPLIYLYLNKKKNKKIQAFNSFCYCGLVKYTTTTKDGNSLKKIKFQKYITAH